MPKKKIGKHLQFYIDCIRKDEMPRSGLCGCAENGFISKQILSQFIPSDESLECLYKEKLLLHVDISSYWGAGTKVNNGYSIYQREYGFTPLRQTIVLFMAALNGEL